MVFDKTIGKIKQDIILGFVTIDGGVSISDELVPV